jgi:hypothetical protein
MISLFGALSPEFSHRNSNPFPAGTRRFRSCRARRLQAMVGVSRLLRGALSPWPVRSRDRKEYDDPLRCRHPHDAAIRRFPVRAGRRGWQRHDAERAFSARPARHGSVAGGPRVSPVCPRRGPGSGSRRCLRRCPAPPRTGRSPTGSPLASSRSCRNNWLPRCSRRGPRAACTDRASSPRCCASSVRRSS